MLYMLLLTLYTLQWMGVRLYQCIVLSSLASLSISCLLVLFILENGLLKHCLTQCSMQQAAESVLLSSPLTHTFTTWASSTISPRPGTAPTLSFAVVGEGQKQLLDSHALRPPGRLTCITTHRVSFTVQGLFFLVRQHGGAVPIITLNSPNHHR